MRVVVFNSDWCLVRLTVIDTPGFGDYVNNRDSWMPIIEFLDDQHESYMLQEQQPRRQDKIDLRVHACLYFIRPTGHTLKPLDIEVMKRLCSRVNLIPVIAKADTLSPADLAKFKQRVSIRPGPFYANCRAKLIPCSDPCRYRSPKHQDLPAAD
jgi:septin family protein